MGGQGWGTVDGRRHQSLPAVKKAAAGGPGGSKQGSAWLAIGAPVDVGSGTQLGCMSATACRHTTVAEQRRSGAGAWVWK
jgi:hypothetical protein